jgi:hypothetical protein
LRSLEKNSPKRATSYWCDVMEGMQIDPYRPSDLGEDVKPRKLLDGWARRDEDVDTGAECTEEAEGLEQGWT